MLISAPPPVLFSPQCYLLFIKSVHPALYVVHRRYPGSRLSPGCLAAHKGTHLVLLHSCPDTVHEALLRKTRTSTLLTRGSPARPASEAGYHPCWSGLQVQGTAISPAARKLYDKFLCRVSLLFSTGKRLLSIPRKQGFCQVIPQILLCPAAHFHTKRSDTCVLNH